MNDLDVLFSFFLPDVPLSYGLVDVNIDRECLNGAEFIWDPTKETGVYVRVNCISTEFTAKKHGGEKGVPFRLQVESYTYEDRDNKLVHCGSCQIKVFKVHKQKGSKNCVWFCPWVLSYFILLCRILQTLCCYALEFQVILLRYAKSIKHCLVLPLSFHVFWGGFLCKIPQKLFYVPFFSRKELIESIKRTGRKWTREQRLKK